MHNSKIVFLINDSVRAFTGVYEPDYRDPKDYPSKQEHFKTMDPDLDVGDLVLVESSTRHGFTVVEVTAIDIEPDLTGSNSIRWAVQKVDKAAYEQIVAQEAEAVEAVNAAERRRQKAKLRETMFKDAEEQIANLQLANHSESSDD